LTPDTGTSFAKNLALLYWQAANAAERPHVGVIWHLLLRGARALLTLLRILACMGHALGARQDALLTTGLYKPHLQQFLVSHPLAANVVQ
jgi:hypothetical protein